MNKHTFSSGTEYECFLSTYCEDCRRFVPWEESDEADCDETQKPNCCPIEQEMALARFDGNGERFPDNFVKPDAHGHMECTAYYKGTHPALLKGEPPIADIWRFKKEEEL